MVLKLFLLNQQYGENTNKKKKHGKPQIKKYFSSFLLLLFEVLRQGTFSQKNDNF